MRAVRRALARRETIAGVAAGWAAAILVLALAGLADTPVMLLTAVCGPAAVGLLTAHRQARALHRRLTRLQAGLDRVQGRLDRIDRRLASSAAQVGALSTRLGQAPEQTRRAVARDTTAAYRQLEALLNLHAMIPVAGRVPATRGWAASPDLLLLLVETLRSERPSLVVECGSGVSTLWLALAIRRFGLDARLVALEHEERYARATAELLAAHGVADVAEVRHAPLEPVVLDGEQWPWYARAGWAGLRDIGLLFVDGPPGPTRPHARFPALPLLAERLADGAVVVLDDLVRADEQEIVARWLAAASGVVESRVDLEKGASILRCPRTTSGTPAAVTADAIPHAR